jgi:rfaE bifunctional protein nucleotidyltransferase chain/domain
MGKIITQEELKQFVPVLKEEERTIVTTNGSFDLFHAGHLKSLKFAKKQGDILIVGINSDKSVKKYKSVKRPIIPEEQRAEIVASIIYVDYVVLFDETTPVNLLSMIKPNIHVKGSEYKENIPEKDVVESNGGKLIFIERHDLKISTSEIIKRVQELGEE